MGYPFPFVRPYQWRITAGKDSTVKELKDDFWATETHWWKKIKNKNPSLKMRGRAHDERQVCDFLSELRAEKKKQQREKEERDGGVIENKYDLMTKKHIEIVQSLISFFSLYVWSQILGQWYFVLVLLICCFYFSSTPRPPPLKLKLSWPSNILKPGVQYYVILTQTRKLHSKICQKYYGWKMSNF